MWHAVCRPLILSALAIMAAVAYTGSSSAVETPPTPTQQQAETFKRVRKLVESTEPAAGDKEISAADVQAWLDGLHGFEADFVQVWPNGAVGEGRARFAPPGRLRLDRLQQRLRLAGPAA